MGFIQNIQDETKIFWNFIVNSHKSLEKMRKF